MLPALGQYVATLISVFELKYNVAPNALIVGMLDAMYLSKALASWENAVGESFDTQKQSLSGLQLIPSTKGNQEPTVCLI